MKLSSSNVSAAAALVAITMSAVQGAPISTNQRIVAASLSVRTNGARLLDWSISTLDNVSGLIGPTASSAAVPRFELGSASNARTSLSIKGKKPPSKTPVPFTNEELELLEEYRGVRHSKIEDAEKQAKLIKTRKKLRNKRSDERRKRRLEKLSKEELELYWKKKYARELELKMLRKQAVLAAGGEKQSLLPAQSWSIKKPRTTVGRAKPNVRGRQNAQLEVPLSANDDRHLTRPLIEPSVAAPPALTPEAPFLTLALNGPPIRSTLPAPSTTLKHDDGLDLTLAPPEPHGDTAH